MSLLIGVLTFFLILVSLFLVLVVLMQRAKSDGGVGAALGSGMTESTFGAETGNVLTKATINAAIAFFVLSFVLYLAHIYQRNHMTDEGSALPKVPASMAVPAASQPAPEAAPATTAPTAASPAAAPTGGENKP
ncbi:MAG: preprotein translocase subunit SecG [Opitutaceae bacterium]|nr:preprotein translocase subunit SecG [Opitutaceae bacterium]